MRAVIELQARLAKLTPARTELTKVEEEVRAALDEVGRELMSVAFAAADIDDQEIHVNGVLHGKIDRRAATIHTSFGPVEQEQSVYGRGRGYQHSPARGRLRGSSVMSTDSRWLRPSTSLSARIPAADPDSTVSRGPLGVHFGNGVGMPGLNIDSAA